MPSLLVCNNIIMKERENLRTRLYITKGSKYKVWWVNMSVDINIIQELKFPLPSDIGHERKSTESLFLKQQTICGGESSM